MPLLLKDKEFSRFMEFLKIRKQGGGACVCAVLFGRNSNWRRIKWIEGPNALIYSKEICHNFFCLTSGPPPDQKAKESQIEKMLISLTFKLFKREAGERGWNGSPNK